MKDLIDLMRQEQKALMAKAKPYLDQYDIIQKAINAMTEKEIIAIVPKKSFPKPYSSQKCRHINAPQGLGRKVLSDAIISYLQAGVGQAKTKDILKYLRKNNIIKRGFNNPWAYIDHNGPIYKHNGLWHLRNERKTA